MVKFNINLLIVIFCVFSTSILSAQTFTSAESAEYDAANDRWLVSSGSIIAVAADGTLSFFGSAQGSFGLEIMNNTLFAVGTSGVIRGYDLDSADEVMNISIPGAGFLNGLTNNGLDKIYVTDFSNNDIIEVNVSDLNNPVATTIVNNTQTTPNGIIYDEENNRLIYTSWQSGSAPIKAVNLADFSISDLATTSVGNIDGIDEDNDGSYYISSWSPQGRITKYDSNFENPVTVTTPFISQPADIGYSLEKDILAIPVGSNVVFVDFSTPSSVSTLAAHVHQLQLSPNPFQDDSVLEFYLDKKEYLHLSIYDLEGKKVKDLLDGPQIQGWHKVNLQGHTFSSGQYYAVLTTKMGRSTVPFVVHK